MSSAFKDRFQRVILESGKSKSFIAEQLGVSAAYVSQMCSGSRIPSDRTISDICRIFDIQEDWLRHGLEPMRAARSEDEEIAAMVGRVLHGSSDFQRAVVKMICSRTSEQLQALEESLRAIYESL